MAGGRTSTFPRAAGPPLKPPPVSLNLGSCFCHFCLLCPLPIEASVMGSFVKLWEHQFRSGWERCEGYDFDRETLFVAGRFRKGQLSPGTVGGESWLLQDTCAGGTRPGRAHGLHGPSSVPGSYSARGGQSPEEGLGLTSVVEKDIAVSACAHTHAHTHPCCKERTRDCAPMCKADCFCLI